MDCDTARTLLAVRRPVGDSELGPEDLATLDRHLAGCSACAAMAQRQEAFDTAVAVAMKADPLPAGLKNRLLDQLATRSRTATRRKLLFRSLAAATVMLTVLLVYGGYRAVRPTFDAEGLALQLEREADAPEAAVRDWLQAEGLPAELPVSLNFRHYVFHGKQQLDRGGSVPVVLFRVQQPGQPPGTLRLYLVRNDTFRGLDSVADALTSRHTVRVLFDDRAKSGVIYLAVFDTPALDIFLRQDKRPEA